MSSPPRLLFLIPALKRPPETGGELFNLKLADGLSSHFDLTVATFEDLPGFARSPKEYADAVMHFMDKNGPFDAVVSDTYTYPFSVDANQAIAKRCALIGFGQAVYSERFRRPWTKWSENRKMAAAQAPSKGQIVVSEAMRAHAIALGLAASQVAVVTPGYDLPSNPQMEPLAEPYRFVGAGSYQPSKGQLITVEGFIQVVRARPEFAGKLRLDLYGNQRFAPDYVEALRNLIRDHHAESFVGLHDAIPQAQLWGEFSKSHGFAFVATGEGVGMVTVEAMALGCAPILTDDVLSQELIGSAKAGVLVPRTAEGVSQGVQNLLDDTARWQQIRLLARERSKQLTRSWNEAVDQFAGEVKRLAGLVDS